MSYASDAREELAGLPLGSRCCVRSEMAGMLNAGGIISLSGGIASVYIQSETASIAGRAFSLRRRATGARAARSAHRRGAEEGGETYRVRLDGEEAARVLSESGLDGLGFSEGTLEGIVGKSCCRRAFLRGAFLVCGTLGAPEKGYHLEWRLAREHLARALGGMLEEEGVRAKTAFRRERYVLYVKEADAIRDALGLMGAVTALLELENVRVVKELRNRVNRQVNCENANVDKSTDAAYRQIEAIRHLERRGILKKLPSSLREAAEIRLEHPESTLEEMTWYFVKPVGKSGVNHRLRRLLAIANEDRVREKSAKEEHIP